MSACGTRSGGTDLKREPSKLSVTGLEELVKTFDVLQGKTQSEVRIALAKAGEPVRSAAEQLALVEIRNIGDQWSKMRLGITPKMVYIAPAARRRRRGSPRPKLAPLLLEKAMWPAAARHQPEVFAAIGRAIDDLGREEGF